MRVLVPTRTLPSGLNLAGRSQPPFQPWAIPSKRRINFPAPGSHQVTPVRSPSNTVLPSVAKFAQRQRNFSGDVSFGIDAPVIGSTNTTVSGSQVGLTAMTDPVRSSAMPL